MKAETGMPVATEVANAYHVEACLKNNIDYLWIGARTTVNPFYVQEIAEALRGVDIPVMVKNPLHPDIGLWIGALERFNQCGIKQLMAIHRGFYSYEVAPYRNEPKWDLAIKLKRWMPELPIICDPSHISGTTELISEVSQTALDLGMDAKQQLTPDSLSALMSNLVLRKSDFDDTVHLEKLRIIRKHVDGLDEKLLSLLAERLALVSEIGTIKKENNVMIFQLKRFFEILKTRKALGDDLGLPKDLVHELFELIHKHSINIQNKI